MKILNVSYKSKNVLVEGELFYWYYKTVSTYLHPRKIDHFDNEIKPVLCIFMGTRLSESCLSTNHFYCFDTNELIKTDLHWPEKITRIPLGTQLKIKQKHRGAF